MTFGTTPTTVSHGPGWFPFVVRRRLPERLFARPEPGDKTLVHDGDRQCLRTIPVVEVAAGYRGHAQDPEVVRSGSQELGRLSFAPATGPSLDLERQRRHPIHGNVARDGVLFDSRNGLQLRVEPIEIRKACCGARVTVGWQSQRSHQDVFGIADAGFGADNLQEAPHQDALLPRAARWPAPSGLPPVPPPGVCRAGLA